MSIKAKNEITYPSSNFNGCTVEVWEYIYNVVPHDGCNYLSMMGLKLTNVSKMGPDMVD